MVLGIVGAWETVDELGLARLYFDRSEIDLIPELLVVKLEPTTAPWSCTGGETKTVFTKEKAVSKKKVSSCFMALACIIMINIIPDLIHF